MQTGVLKRLDDRGVRILESGVFPDEDDVNFVEESVVTAPAHK